LEVDKVEAFIPIVALSPKSSCIPIVAYPICYFDENIFLEDSDHGCGVLSNMDNDNNDDDND
jgi:hypothetical protein